MQRLDALVEETGLPFARRRVFTPNARSVPQRDVHHGPDETVHANIRCDLPGDAPTRLNIPLYPPGVLPRADPRLVPQVPVGDPAQQAFVMGTIVRPRKGSGPIVAAAEAATMSPAAST